MENQMVFEVVGFFDGDFDGDFEGLRDGLDVCWILRRRL